jgi:hypothetical protein
MADDQYAAAPAPEAQSYAGAPEAAPDAGGAPPREGGGRRERLPLPDLSKL